MRNIETEELADIDYPAHPEERMAESQIHFDYITLLVDNLRMVYRERADEVAVFGDLAWYPIPRNNLVWTAPDVMVCFGVPQDRGSNRPSYAQHRENNVVPSVVFEIDSESNTSDEVEDKREWYETYGVQEYYWVFTEIPEVHVFIREGNQLVEQTGFTEWTSPLLGIRMDWSGTVLRIENPDGSLMQPTREYARIQRERAELAEARAEQEAQRAEQEAQRAAQEAQRVQRLLEFIRQQGIEPPPE